MCISIFDFTCKYKISRPKHLFLWCLFLTIKKIQKGVYRNEGFFCCEINMNYPKINMNHPRRLAFILLRFNTIDDQACSTLILVKIINLLYLHGFCIFWYCKLPFKFFHFFLESNVSVQKFLKCWFLCILRWDEVEDDSGVE